MVLGEPVRELSRPGLLPGQQDVRLAAHDLVGLVRVSRQRDRAPDRGFLARATPDARTSRSRSLGRTLRPRGRAGPGRPAPGWGVRRAGRAPAAARRSRAEDQFLPGRSKRRKADADPAALRISARRSRHRGSTRAPPVRGIPSGARPAGRGSPSNPRAVCVEPATVCHETERPKLIGAGIISCASQIGEARDVETLLRGPIRASIEKST